MSDPQPASPSYHHLFSPSSSTSFPAPPVLTADRQLKLREVEVHFGAVGKTWPVVEGSEELAPLSEREMMFLSRETILRFLTGTKDDVQAAIKRLDDCIVWRRTARVEDIDFMFDDVEYESTTGKNLVLGFTPRGQPVIYFFPNRNTTPLDKRRAIHAVFMVERARDLMLHGVTDLTCIFNFTGKRQGPPTSISVARETLHILSNYYPENLSLCIMQDMPWVVKAFVNLMWPFVDAATKKKVKFASADGHEVVQDGNVERGSFLKVCGGDLDLPYHHDTYWPALRAACKTRREAHLETWRSLGPPAVGREERLWKVLRREVGGDEGGMGVAVQVEAREAGGEEKLSKEEVGEEKEDEGVIGAGAGAGAGVVGA
ncbi:hypothetical protein JCM24511_01366 [Saitozyma sp. JCM 24511]|nr:hypothetical protein JCM24511_01366 [Saitozyma sp. JCM 24511]